MTSKELCLQEEVFLDQEPVQPVLHGPQDQGQGAEGGQDHQRVNHEWRRQKNGNQTHRRLLKQNQKRISMKAKNPDFSEQYTYDQWRRVPSSHPLSYRPASEEFYYEKNSTKWVQISERINWCSIKMPRKNIEIVSQSSPLTKMAKIVIF